ncbi:MAG: hypothetical protein HY362_02195 [Candidatus Aenigmarchaeota archaeon]|nr:hypothetical protein [Candidatus Aenigmarchaeota archaeon]
MRHFEVTISNKKGALSELCETLAAGNVNIRAIAAEGEGKKGKLKFVVDNDSLAKQALKHGGYKFVEHEILPIKMLDKPGELARVAKALSHLGINIESLYILGKENGQTEVAFKVSDLQKAKSIFG